MKTSIKYTIATTAVTVLAACGGGGGGGSNDMLYPLSDALAEYALNSTTINVSITGSVSNGGESYIIGGSGKIVENTSSALFNGASAKKKSQITTGFITVNGASNSLDDVTYYYFNNNNQPLGYITASAYCVSSNVKSIPMYVSAGQSGEWYSTDCYTNSSKAVKVGTSETSYQVQSVTDKTADLIINQVFKDSSGKITAPVKLVYGLNALGDVNFKEQSTSIDYAGANLSLIISAK